MDALTLLKAQAELAESLVSQVVGEVGPAQASWRLDGSAANTIGATVLHLYHNEDWAVRSRLGQPTRFETDGWGAKLGVDPRTVFSSPALLDIGLVRAYAAGVSSATRAYIDVLSPAALDEQVDGPNGKRPVARMLSALLITHKLTHLGEISALLGCQGVKGFPF